MIRIFPFLFAMAVVGAAPLVALAAVTPGTDLVGNLQSSIDSKNAKQNVTMPAGSTVTVQVLQARRQAAH